ncbi:MAG: DUF3261 domain-containing protein [Proteobacteria bacterium]|nr:hypothetical protein [Desulfocapsa sp.]MBU3943717.1 DUF3261 domain-containing protein [Pseudomonadota bacterium]MBU3984644.1 DUF3261 domain-containing protein [Pseudomonadota bacterium]MBU4029252.1 DUF3261 domain-containing protein [Pseudomonadota bacterium]MBU4042517.1 DUF3261 domain-containing protein [Pseudomonadota bacterium]
MSIMQRLGEKTILRGTLKSVLAFVFLLLLAACSALQPVHLPDLTALDAVDDSQAGQLLQRCRNNFVTGNWQFVHSIAFKRADGGGATVIGVTVLDGQKLHCALMTVEGLVLFEAELAQEKLTVSRALPPFDKPEFARGLIRDVQAIFLPPAAEEPKTGRLVGGELVCRYQADNGQITDLLVDDDGSRMNIYDPDLNRSRSIVAGSPISVAAERVPETLELTASGLSAYTLTMTLISADKI